MRKIKLLPTEFYHFKKLAKEVFLKFECQFIRGTYIVIADSLLLENLGY